MGKRSCRNVTAFIGAVCMLILSIFQFAPSVYADTKIGTVTMNCQFNGNPVSDISWSIYRAAEKNSNGSYVLTGDFAGYNVSLDVLTDSEFQDAADTLENYSKTDKIPPMNSAVTDKNGKVSFKISRPGLYLITGESWSGKDKRFIPSAMFIEITSEKLDSNDPNITVYPKYVIKDIPTKNQKYSVSKKWTGDEEVLDKRPDFVKAEIYKDGVLLNTITLNESNNWTYSWTSEGDHQWLVKEVDVDEFYNVVYKNSGYDFVIENHYDSSNGVKDDNEYGYGDSDNNGEGNGEGDADESNGSNGGSSINGNENEKLPQTGQLWWPVPLLIASGFIFIAVGIRMNFEKEDKNEKK